jgi:hypothetical protein
MARIPAGRTSSVRALNKVFILQTEFVAKPKPRIVTSVALDGQIIHKVERTYDSPIESDDELKLAETAVANQHQNLARKMQTSGAEFIKQTRSIKISVIDRLALVPGISSVTDVEEKLSSPSPLPVYLQSKYVSDIADAVTQSTKMGPLKLAAMISEQGKFILAKSEGKPYILTLKPDADIRQVLSEAIKE